VGIESLTFPLSGGLGQRVYIQRGTRGPGYAFRGRPPEVRGLFRSIADVARVIDILSDGSAVMPRHSEVIRSHP